MKKIAVIGGGCGGCATSYFIKKHSAKDVNQIHLDLFERSEILGGRLRHVHIEEDNLTVELGGNIFHKDVNPNVMLLLKSVEQDLVQDNRKDMMKMLELYNPYGNIKSSAVFNGRKMEIITGKSILLSRWKEWLDNIFWFTFGISIIIGLLNSLYEKITTFIQIITRYGFGTLYKTWSIQRRCKVPINEMFTTYGFNEIRAIVEKYFPSYLSRNCRTVMQVEYKIDPKFITDILESVARNIYSQNLENYHQMAMITTLMAGDDTGLRTFVNGNANFFKTAAEIAGTNFKLNSAVQTISKTKNDKFKITYTKYSNNGKQVLQEEFDCVVLCTPVEIAGIQFENIDMPNDLIQNREFVGCHIAIVRGEVNPAFFGYKDAGEVPQLIRTTEEAETKNNFKTFISFQHLWNTAKKQKIYKIQSRHKLSDNELDQLFLKRDFLHQHQFQIAYPRLRTLKENEKLFTKICNGLYFNNTVESVSSAMEASVWAARNVAQLVVHDLKK